MAPTSTPNPPKTIVKNAVAREEPVGNATERKAGFFSLVWVVPLLALALTGWLIWNNTLNNGPIIHITTNSAAGIEEGKTLIKTNSVTVGVVTDVVLDPDYRNAVLTVQMDTNTENLLREDTNFWIVKPRIGSAGISGLDTLLSGSYIELSRGTSDEFATEFKALDEPPVRLNGEDGVMVSLTSKDSRKLDIGDEVSFRGFVVGAITDVSLNLETQGVEYKVFVRKPYSDLVKPNTKFWISSGVDMSLNSSGVSLRTESFNNVVMGGLSFDNFLPKEAELQAQPVADNTVFELYDRREDARLASLEGAPLYVVLLEDSVYNIAPGSSVIYRGVQVGEVVKVPWFGPEHNVFTAKGLPVMIAMTRDLLNKAEIAEVIDGFLREGTLCAQVGSANVVMSNNQIDLVHDPEQKCSLVSRLDYFADFDLALADEPEHENVVNYRGYHVIPLIPAQSLSNQVDEIMAEAKAVLENFNGLDMEGISDDLRGSLQAFTGAMNAFTQSNASLQNSKLIKKLSDAFDNLNKTVKSYGPGTKLYDSIGRSLKQLEQILKDLGPVMNEMGQNPRSLIFGGQNDPVPMSPHSNRRR